MIVIVTNLGRCANVDTAQLYFTRHKPGAAPPLIEYPRSEGTAL